ncbi:DNA-binding protein [Kaistella haifensis]|nr:DNA-binding protein [Kaistella haifensis]
MNTFKRNLTFEDLPDAITKLINDIAEMRNQIEQNNQPNENENEYLNYEETMKFLNVSRTTLWMYAKQGKITPKGKGKRRFYAKKEIIAFMENLANS